MTKTQERALTGPVAALEDRRARAIALLSDAFEQDRIELDVLEKRLAQVRAAADIPSIEVLVADLEPAAPAFARSVATAPPQGLAVAILSGTSREGTWVVPRHLSAIAVFGGVDLDLRDAYLGPGVTEIWAFALFGGIEIVLPPDVRVDGGGLGILGGFDHAPRSDPDLPPETPVVRIRGLAILGGVEVTTRLPGESEKEAKRRRKREAKRARALPPGKR